MKFLKKHPIFSSILFSELLGLGMTALSLIRNTHNEGIGMIVYALFVMGMCIGTFIIYPFVLTAINVVTLFWRRPEKQWLRKEKQFEYITVVLGFLYSGLVLFFYDIQFWADWTEVLYNTQVHTPIWTESYPTVITIGVIGVLGYFVLSLGSLKKMPPLVVVCGIAAMYIGVGGCVLWIVQIFSGRFLLLWLFPANCIVMAAKTIRYKMAEWNEIGRQEDRKYEKGGLDALNRKLQKAERWPLAAFILMWPMLGVMIGILTLFGQAPDAVIKAWTETTDWHLSQRVGPQNIYYDEHYLCTVAAGGHERVVKPLRMGERHGHPVIVNRQLCVANAFEQLLEERTPEFHRHLRHFYDTWGFPVARLIHSPYIADGIYLLMKPLEWFFLIVLYFCDVQPENRIAVQYLPKK